LRTATNVKREGFPTEMHVPGHRVPHWEVRTMNVAKRAFTLLEILIVVVILGILAAIVLPNFSSATNDARAGNIEAQLASLQNSIELYRAQNNGAFPSFAGTTSRGWDELLAGDYIKDLPKNPAGDMTSTVRTTVTAASGATTGSATAGWVWNTTSRRIYASYFNEASDPAVVTATATD
jgi:general secretion pathway protein G